jgi:hypothetical protein
MTHRSTGRKTDRSSRGRRWGVLLGVLVLVAGLAWPAQASMNKTRVFERDGHLLVVTQDVGNQAFAYQWVEGDPRRHAEDPLTLYYRIDQTELPPGVTWADTEAAIDGAAATFNQVTCGRSVLLERLPSDPGQDLGFIQHQLGYGGADSPQADITFAGWLPASFMTAAGVPGSFAVALPLVWQTDDTLALGVEVLDPARSFTDVNRDRKHDLYATEIYFNRDWNYVVDDPDLANTLFYIDVQSIVLHELGHALGMDHFGRTQILLDDNGELVDLIINPNSANLMNTNNYMYKRDLSGSDTASFCQLYGNWGKKPR